MAVRQIVLDTETTGLYANQGDRLIEFAGLEMIDRRLTGKYLHVYVHPERDIAKEAIAVHGITLEMLADKPKFAGVATEIAEFLRDSELIIHNAAFDVGFLDMEFGRLGMPKLDTVVSKVTDTVAMARKLYPGQKVNLDALCNRLGVDKTKRVLHGALIDCELLAEVYLGMTRGQFSLDVKSADDGKGGGLIQTLLPGQSKPSKDYKVGVPAPTAKPSAVCNIGNVSDAGRIISVMNPVTGRIEYRNVGAGEFSTIQQYMPDGSTPDESRSYVITYVNEFNVSIHAPVWGATLSQLD